MPTQNLNSYEVLDRQLSIEKYCLKFLQLVINFADCRVELTPSGIQQSRKTIGKRLPHNAVS